MKIIPSPASETHILNARHSCTSHNSSAHQVFAMLPKEFISMKYSGVAFLLLGLISVGTSGQTKHRCPMPPLNQIQEAVTSSQSTSSDQDSATQAAQGSSAEVALAKIVAAKNKTPSVKQYSLQTSCSLLLRRQRDIKCRLWAALAFPAKMSKFIIEP
jgi:hypothetical protein